MHKYDTILSYVKNLSSILGKCIQTRVKYSRYVVPKPLKQSPRTNMHFSYRLIYIYECTLRIYL